MQDNGSHDRVVPVPNLLDYFRTSIDTVISEQGSTSILMPHITSLIC